MNNNKIKNLPEMERPYEKCIKYGPCALSDAELLAVILKTGTKELTSVELARQLLLADTGEYGLNVLYKHNYSTFTSIKGIGKVKAVTLMCILEIASRISRTSIDKRVSFDNPQRVSDFFMEEMRHLEKEQVVIVLLDSKNKMITNKVSTIGTINSSLFSPREIIVDALKNNATGIIVIHNHPSGDPFPSSEDLKATGKLKEACEIIGIALVDHIIIGDRVFYSFKKEKLI